MIQMYKLFWYIETKEQISTRKQSTRFEVRYLLSKPMFIKILGAMVARDQGIAKKSVHLSNPNIYELPNVHHDHNLSSPGRDSPVIS